MKITGRDSNICHYLPLGSTIAGVTCLLWGFGGYQEQRGPASTGQCDITPNNGFYCHHQHCDFGLLRVLNFLKSWFSVLR